MKLLILMAILLSGLACEKTIHEARHNQPQHVRSA